MNVSGKIPYYTMPPVRNQEEPSEAKIVSEFAKEFDIDEVYNSESSFIGSLKLMISTLLKFLQVAHSTSVRTC